MSHLSLDANDRKALLERFVRYVQVDTQSDENSTTSPSTEKQKDLARILVEELHGLGCADALMDEWGYVSATVPSNIPASHPAANRVPTIGLIAHLDTYHAAPGANVKPQVIEKYDGNDITLPGDPREVIRAAANPTLGQCIGHTIITSDGTTLLGADDKAGIAEIMTVVDWLFRHPDFLRPTLRVGFTTDEEVGRGTEHFDVAAFAAKYAYTLDGSTVGEIEDETFCADSAMVVVEGHDVHPGYAKDKMINAVRVASAIVNALPQDCLPETTEGRQSYLHPYDFRGDVSKVELKMLVRAFTEEGLKEREDSLRMIVALVEKQFPQARISVEIKQSYRNMTYKLAEDPKVLNYAIEAVERMGIKPIRHAIRGGTDGSRLSFMGLLTPNIWAGSQNFHSVQEWVSLDWMAKASEVCLNLMEVWVEKSV